MCIKVHENNIVHEKTVNYHAVKILLVIVNKSLQWFLIQLSASNADLIVLEISEYTLQFKMSVGNVRGEM